jgi:23S rRNA (uracil1939-C5)-methyltransferase
MIKKKSLVEDVDIIDIGAKGTSIGRSKDGEIFLTEGVVPGDIVNLRYLRNKKGLKWGVVEEIKEYSSFRADPFCQYFGDCGGCSWQNLQYQAQLQFKEKVVKDAIWKISGIKDADIRPILGCDDSKFYRNKLEFSFSNQKWVSAKDAKSEDLVDKENGLGFHPKGFFAKVVDVKKCYLQADLSNDIRNYIREIALEKEYSFYNSLKHAGFLRNYVCRNNQDGQWMIIFSFGQNKKKDIHYLLGKLKDKFSQICSIYYTINEKKNDSIQDLDLIHYFGDKYLEESLNQTKFLIGPKSFFQTNTKQTKVLFDVVKDFANLTGEEVVYDMYSGIGSIGLYLSHLCKEVFGVEEVEPAVKDAVQNVIVNNISNAQFVSGDVKLTMPELIKETGKPDVLILDPPRAGLHKDICSFINGLQIEKIVYVSCNPATQARDIALLSTNYKLIKCQPVDMFPQTHHVENVALLNLL